MISGQASLLLFSISSSVLAPAASYGCTPSEDFKGPPTNFELAQQADVIFVGKLARSVGTNGFDSKIIVEPQTLLKGKALPKSAQIRGFLSDRIINDGDRRFKVDANSSDQYDIWRPHPEVWAGGCSRYSFNKNSKLVLFFNFDGKELEWIDPTFGRGSEDVADDNALWVRAVKLYAKISQLPEAQQRPALIKEMSFLRSANYGDDVETLLADDIERQLAKCGPVAEFGPSDKACGKSQWVYNIANMSYLRNAIPQTIELTAAANTKSRTDWMPYVIGFFAMAALGLATLFGWHRWSKAKLLQ